MSDGEGTSLASVPTADPSSKKQNFQYFGWVYHLGVNKIGHEYCHLRFLFIRGKYAEMYKRDPHENPGIVSSEFFFSVLKMLVGWLVLMFVNVINAG